MQKDYLARLIQSEIDAGVLSGASIGVWKHGERQYRENFGVRDTAAGDPVPDNAIFRLYSATKPICAVAAMLLVERGQLDLLAPVSQYLEGFQNQTAYEGGRLVPVTREVTVRDLLNMTSGIVYPAANEPDNPAGAAMEQLFSAEIDLALKGRGHSTTEFCNAIGRVPLAFQPGTAWRYGASADVMGGVIEAVTQKPFRSFLKDELLLPLGMADTDFFVPQEKRGRLVTMMEYQEALPHLKPYQGNRLVILDADKNPAFSSGGAGLFSTVDDYGKFACMLLNGGTFNNRRILGKNTVRFLRTNQLSPQIQGITEWPQLQGYGYGNFMRVLLDPAMAASTGSAGEYGWDGWAGVYMAIDPVEDTVIVYFISRINYNCDAMRRKMKAIVYAM